MAREGELVVKGWRELVRSLAEADQDTRRELRATLRQAGETVQTGARQRLLAERPNDPRTAAGYRIRVRQRGVAVAQALRKTTGLHPEWGAWQMRHALVPALVASAEETDKRMEHAIQEVCAMVNASTSA